MGDRATYLSIPERRLVQYRRLVGFILHRGLRWELKYLLNGISQQTNHLAVGRFVPNAEDIFRVPNGNHYAALPGVGCV